jgi:hypothetical protein
MHAATRFPPVGPPEAQAEIFCRGEVIEFAFVAIYGLDNGSVGCVAGRAGGNARHRPKHAATRLPPAAPPDAHAIFLESMNSHLWRFTA